MIEVADQKLSCCPECGAIYRTSFALCPRDGAPLAPLVGDPMEGATFADRYVVEECVGEGAMGRVYRARHVRLSRRFAIKILWGDLAADPVMRERFAREAEVASRLDHPNVVSVIDFGENESGLVYLAMDYVEGRDLGDIIDRDGALPQARVIALARGLCRGLQHAHDLGMVHRDFKPDNVIVIDKDGIEVPRILDFGLAILNEITGGGGGGGRLTTAGMVMGTPAYIAPEQAAGHELDHRADLYSLGVTLYELLAGVPPFEGSPIELARMNVSTPPPPLASRNPDVQVSADLERIVDRLLAKRPDDRPPSASRVLEALDELAPGTGAARPRPPSVPTVYGQGSGAFGRAATAPADSIPDLPQPPRRKRWPILLLGALLLAGGAGAFAILSSQSDAAATADAGPVTAVATRPDVADAGVPPADAAVDAAPPPDAPAIADATVRDPERTRRRSRRQRRPDRATSSPSAKKTSKTYSVDDVSKLYKRVGAAVDRLEHERGAEAATPFRDRYFAVPFTDAVRNPSIRPDVVRRLRKLARDVRRARK